jgi:hypothetical protein
MRRLAATLAVLALAAPAAAQAQRPVTNAPPGNSAIDEYLESVPSANGNTPTRGIAQSRPRPIAGSAGRALRAQGALGKRLERIVSASAPRRAIQEAERRGGASGSGSGSASPAAPGADAIGRSPLSSVADAVLTGSGGGTGMGAAFPVLLIVLAAGTLVLGLRRRRSAS